MFNNPKLNSHKKIIAFPARIPAVNTLKRGKNIEILPKSPDMAETLLIFNMELAESK